VNIFRIASLVAIGTVLALPLSVAQATGGLGISGLASEISNDFTPIEIASKGRYNGHPLFKPHVYVGQVFGRSARASTGNPHIVVFDRRHEFGEVYQCSYFTYRKKRAVVCD